eukprot:TRINITY_DN5602_c0_g1_i2.p1 TRINITY_DN5602_c0_g1~~TRINITY_DN5602_c0_g1_i2.p1  ORF type:complete len:579 (-),score=99.91 TRINITY_DN5602_c0_g1_i2:54-1550(-)
MYNDDSAEYSKHLRTPNRLDSSERQSRARSHSGGTTYIQKHRVRISKSPQRNRRLSATPYLSPETKLFGEKSHDHQLMDSGYIDSREEKKKHKNYRSHIESSTSSTENELSYTVDYLPSSMAINKTDSECQKDRIRSTSLQVTPLKLSRSDPKLSTVKMITPHQLAATENTETKPSMKMNRRNSDPNLLKNHKIIKTPKQAKADDHEQLSDRETRKNSFHEDDSKTDSGEKNNHEPHPAVPVLRKVLHKLKGSNKSKETEKYPDVSKTWKGSLIEFFNKDYNNLPIHTDIPRLAKKMCIKIENNVIFSGEEEPEDIVFHFFRKLAKALGDEKAFQFIEDEFKTIVPEDKTNEMSNLLQVFLVKLCENEGNVEPLTLRVLKCAHQKTLLIGYNYIKGMICPSVGRIKDVPGGWHIDIEIFSDKIFVIHTKKQQSSPTEDITRLDFTFDWQLKVEYDREALHIVMLNCDIINVDVDKSLPLAKQKKILHALENRKKHHQQ